MLRNKYVIGGAIIAVLVVANIINYFYSNWGLITVKAHDVPIGQVIKSIERQGWVTIYSNIDPTTKISMYVDHVSLPEAMETLSVNAEAQWHLAFFVAPTPAQVKSEIRAFTDGSDRNDETSNYSFMTPLAMISNESTPISDPRRQAWPGIKPATAAPTPPPATATDDAAATPEEPPKSVQGYLRAFAERADIYISAPTAWDPPVSTAPSPSSSIASAIKNFVGDYHGSVKQALILRGRPQRVTGAERRPRGGGGGFRGGNMDWGVMEDRMRNAINGLPAAAQPAALDELNKEVQFQKEVRLAPPEQRRDMFMKHMIDKRLDGDNNWRRSPEKRAQMYARVVSNRSAATGKR